MKTLSIIIICIGFLAVNFLLRKALASVKRKTGILGFANRYIPVLELGFWSVFAFWAISLVFEGSRFFAYLAYLLFTLVFILFFWFFLRDYLSGIQLKTRYNLSSGQYFRSGQIRGVVKKIKLLFMEVQTEEGSTCKIPYAQIDQKSIELNIQESRGGESLIKVKLDQQLNESDTARKINELVINSPWCSHKSQVRIHVKETEHGLKSYEISCKTNSEHGSKRIKELIERTFKST